MKKLSSKALEDMASKVTVRISASDSDPDKFIAKIQEVWPVVREVLDAVKVLTGDKVDKIIDDIIALGDKIAAGKGTVADQAEFIQKICKNWDKIRKVLKAVKIFCGKKVDRVIDKFIELGDLMAK